LIQQFSFHKGRLVLASLVISGVFNFTGAIKKVYDSSVEKWTLILLMTQFHFMFYIGRPLPNTFGLIFFLHAYAYWLTSKQSLFVWLSAASILIFRSELAIICGIMLIITLAKRQLSFATLILNGIEATFVFVGLSVLVDSYFWDYWVWPEGQVLWFNTILNKSSEWGTSPFFWYFYSALPRAMLLSLLIVPLACMYDAKKALATLIVPAIGFVFVYSFLPHKELRFIIYTFPVLSAAAAKGLVDL